MSVRISDILNWFEKHNLEFEAYDMYDGKIIFKNKDKLGFTYFLECFGNPMKAEKRMFIRDIKENFEVLKVEVWDNNKLLEVIEE